MYGSKIIIVGSSMEALNYKPVEGHITIAVNNAISITKEHTDYWFTLDPGAGNLNIMKQQPYKCEYVAAVPDDFGESWSRVRSYRQPRPPNVKYMQRIVGNGVYSSHYGLCEDKNQIATGNSGYGALNFAYHFEPSEIVLLGFSGKNSPKFDGNQSAKLEHLPKLFESAKLQLDKRNIVVYNANIDTEIKCFTRKPFVEFV